IGVHREQRGVVVEHLLEMRNRPFGVDAVAAEPAAELIVDPSVGHARKRDRDDFQRALVAARCVAPETEPELERVWKLRRTAKASVDGVEGTRERREGKLGSIDG